MIQNLENIEIFVVGKLPLPNLTSLLLSSHSAHPLPIGLSVLCTLPAFLRGSQAVMTRESYFFFSFFFIHSIQYIKHMFCTLFLHILTIILRDLSIALYLELFKNFYICILYGWMNVPLFCHHRCTE